MSGMTQEMKNSTGVRKPGQKLLNWGAGVIVLGLLFVVMGLTSTEIDGNGVRTTVGPTPFAWVTLTAGVALVAWGFGKRILAAVEKN